MNCKNCNAEVSAKFCPECGQKANTIRLTYRDVFSMAFTSLTNFELPFIRTIIHLFSKPGSAILDYVKGKRARYYNPVGFLVICMSISVLVEFIAQHYGLTNAKKERGVVMSFLDTHTTLMVFILLPVIAVFLRLFFYKSGRNLAEQSVFLAYAFGAVVFFYSVATILGLKFLSFSSQLNLAIFFLYPSWAAIKFNETTVLSGFFRCLAAFILAMLLFASTIIGLEKVISG